MAIQNVLTSDSPNSGRTKWNANDGELDTRVTTAQATADDHVADTTAAHAASAISYAGSSNLSSANVEAALDELDGEKAPTSHQHAAGDITSGTMATARLGSGTANSSTFLRGDQAYAQPPAYYPFSRTGTFVSPVTGATYLPVIEARTLNAVYVTVGTAPTASTTISLKRRTSGNTVTEIATVTLAANARDGSTTGLSVALAAGDSLRVDVTSGGTAGSDLTVVAKAA